MLMFNKCKHQWKVIDKQIVPCIADTAKRAGFTSIAGYCDTFVERHRLVCACSVCGELNVIVTDTYQP